jgi:hypothetical protein
MRVRKLDANGDRQFGLGPAGFWINQPDGVGQIIGTRLRLWLGQWYLKPEDGTPWLTKVLGKYTDATRDLVIQSQILSTPGVLSILTYASQLNRDTRVWSVQGSVKTIYGVFPLVGPI